MSNDPQPAQSSVVESPVIQGGSIGFSGATPTDLRFASQHDTLAPHQDPTLPSARFPWTPDTTSPSNPFQSQGHSSPNVNSTPNVVAAPGQQITLTISTAPSQTAAQPTQPSFPSPGVQLNVQTQPPPTTVSPSVTPLSTTQNALTISDVNTATEEHGPHHLRAVEVAKWGIVVGLAGVGMKGFFDSLYFITVEFQNFEKALEDHFIETAQVNPLILKAALLIFATALSVFFGMQLTMTNAKQLRWIRIFSSVVVGIASAAVLHYASTINVLDTFKNL